MVATLSLYCSKNFSRIMLGSCFLRQSLKSCRPRCAPLPSSPKMYPSDGVLSMILSPSKRHEFEPVPKMQAMPSSCLHSARAAANRSRLKDKEWFAKLEIDPQNIVDAVYYHDIGKTRIERDYHHSFYCTAPHRRKKYESHVNEGIEAVKEEPVAKPANDDLFDDLF